MSINCDDNVNTVRKELQKHAKACFKEMNVTKGKFFRNILIKNRIRIN